MLFPKNGRLEGRKGGAWGVRFSLLSFTLGLWLLLPATQVFAQAQAAGAGAEIVPQEVLAIEGTGRGGRSPVHTDAIEREIVTGTWKRPQAGDVLTLPDGAARTWTSVKPEKDGVFRGPALRGGYAYLPVDVSTTRVLLLEASGHSLVYVNGEPRVGDGYGTHWTRLPILLHAGHNDLLFRCGFGGELQVKLTAPQAAALLNTRDLTLPDLRLGEKQAQLGAVIVLNATDAPLTGLAIRAHRVGAADTLTPVPPLLPLSTRKVAFRIVGPAPATPGDLPVELSLVNMSPSRPPNSGGREADQRTTVPPKLGGLGGRVLGTEARALKGKTLDTARITLRVRRPEETYKRTFVSAIDGSVQYYAVHPPTPPARKDAPPLALFLSLHGAGVEAIGQADAYESKSWGVLVAPTNRRPYGFDWEDWGRLDAMEVLALAQANLHTDPSRTYLTGHSMGGHGTWQVGVTFPDRFAAIGPSAGWISFSTYAFGGPPPANPTPMEAMLRRATLPGDTLALARNTTQEGVYILHGGADDNVPVTEARTMSKVLSGFHHDFIYFEQPGAGHWWDVSDEPGADCVDWAPMFDFFARHRLPADTEVRQVDFLTADPGVSARSHWVTIQAQIHPLVLSSVSLRYDPGKRRFVGTTENVARLALALDALRPSGTLTLELDGQKLESVALPSQGGALYLTRTGSAWAVSAPLSPAFKNPERSGPFKQAFRNRMCFVYGTQGTPEENAWALAKARYDAETFWYQGNGAVDVVPDVAFDAAVDRDRNLILYGNADTNAAWKSLLYDSPVQARRGQIQVGSRTLTGDDLACLFVRPRPGSEKASVGVVGGSGIVGLRLTDRQPYFSAGVGYPDCLIFGADMLTQGVSGVRAAGFFGPDWRVETGEFVFAAPEDRRAAR